MPRKLVSAEQAVATTPEEVAATPGSYTGDYLARVLAPPVTDTKRRA